MICLQTFKEKTNKDFNSWKEWVEFVNNNYKYAQTHSKAKDFKGKCNSWDLPSFHPYWDLVVRLQNRKTLFRTIELYNECALDSKKIKYYFNMSTTLHTIELKIKELKKKVYDN
jgi:hypothetical protein